MSETTQTTKGSSLPTADQVLAHLRQRVDQVVREVFFDPMFKEAFEDVADFDLPLAGRF